MKRFIKIIPAVALLSFLFVSCKKDADNDAMLTLDITGLEDLGANARYEGWIMVNGSPVTTGVFSVNGQGQLSQTKFQLDKKQLQSATAFILTVEPYPDPASAPSDVHLLGGDFNASDASLSIAHPAALNTSFSTATGKYILATPTTASIEDEFSGIWFMDLAGGSPVAGLNLPTLPAGWRYEGWAVVESRPLSTGIFSSANGADGAAPFSGPLPAPPFPGEDFIINPPAGLTFPTNLTGGLSVISVEPFPDNSPAPFLLKPLLANIPNSAMDRITYNMDQNFGSFPTGTATRNIK